MIYNLNSNKGKTTRKLVNVYKIHLPKIFFKQISLPQGNYCKFLLRNKEGLKINFKFSLWELLYNPISPNNPQRNIGNRNIWNYVFVIPKKKDLIILP